MPHIGHFLLRTPTLPRHGSAARSEGTLAETVVGGGHDHGTVSDLVVAMKRRDASHAVAHPLFRAALTCASPALLNEVDRQLVSAATLKDETRSAVLRYLDRMSSRATPFGLFAGVTSGTVAETTTLSVGTASEARATLRLEARWSYSLMVRVRDELRRLGALRVVRNPSAVQRADEVQYYRDYEGLSARHAIRRTKLIDLILGVTQAETTVAALEECLFTRTPAAYHERVREVITQSIDSTLLSVVVDNDLDDELALRGMVDHLSRIEPVNRIARESRAVLEALDAGSAVPISAAVERLRSLEHVVRTATSILEVTSTTAGVVASRPRGDASPSVPAGFFDLHGRGTPTISATVAAAIEQSARTLASLHGTQRDVAYGRFVEEFVRRFESRAVPFLEALDEFSGIRCDAVLSQSELQRLQRSEDGRSQETRVRGLASILDNWRREGSPKETVVDQDLLDRIRMTVPDALGETFAVHATLLQTDAESERNLRFHLRSVITGNAATTLGRFGHLDASFQSALDSRLACANRTHALSAEIAWIPESRATNVLRRRCQTQFTISIGPWIRSRDRGVVSLADLYLQFHSGRLRLFSEALGQELLPRLASAYNYRVGTNPLVRFLVMQQASLAAQPFQWSWDCFAHLPSLPRVRVGPAILTPQMWAVSQPLQSAVANAPPRKWMATVAHLRADLHLPQYVIVYDGENEICLDIEDVTGVESFVRVARHQGPMLLFEDLAREYPPAATSAEGGYVHELVVPFRSVETDNGDAKTIAPPWAPDVPRRGPSTPPLVGKWAYFRILCSDAATRTVLRHCQQSVAQTHGKLIEWFYVCFNDPTHHLRIRLTGEQTMIWSEVAPRFVQMLESLKAASVVERYELAHYEPEYARYGGDLGMRLAEEIFCRDTKFAVALGHAANRSQSEDFADAIVLAGLFELLARMLPHVDEQISTLALWQRSSAAVTASGTIDTRRLSARLRACRRLLDSLLVDRTTVTPAPAAPDESPHHAALEQWRAGLKECCESAREQTTDGEWHRLMLHVVPSIGHMYMNRHAAWRSAQIEAPLVFIAHRYLCSKEAQAGRVVAW